MFRLSLIPRILSATAIAFMLALLPSKGARVPDSSYFNALSRLRDPIPAARKLLLIEPAGSDSSRSREELAPVELIWTVAELRAERLLIPESWLRSDETDSDTIVATAQLVSRLNEEFALIDENIAELFEAIRIGSIEPEDADRFVGQLRQIVANSKGRIQDTISRGVDATSVAEMVERFGKERLATELSDWSISLPTYSSAVAIAIPPDGRRSSPAIRRLPYSSLADYRNLETQLNIRLLAMERAGYFDGVEPRNLPSIMQDYVQSLRRELYKQPTKLRAAEWRDAKGQYFSTIADLVDEETEDRLLERIAALEESGDLEDETAAQIEEMKNELSTAFTAARTDYVAARASREALLETVGGSFVIAEDHYAAEGTRGTGTGADHPSKSNPGYRRAVIANSVLLDEYLVAPTGWSKTLLLTAAALLLAIILAPLRAATAALLLPALLPVVGAIFPGLFLLADIWVDPLLVVVVLGGAASASILMAHISRWRVERAVTGSAVDRFPPQLFGRVLLQGGPIKNPATRRLAAVLVVGAPPSSLAEKPSAQHRDAGKREAHEFAAIQHALAARIRELGGVVIGEEGRTVIAVFEKSATAEKRRGKSPETEEARTARGVCVAAKKMASAPLPGGITVSCGVDYGELIFYRSPIGGYRATGPSITYARRLCGLTYKHRRRVLCGDGVVKAYQEEPRGAHFREVGKFVLGGSKERYPFYRFKGTDPPSA